MADLLTWMTLFGLGLIVGGVALLFAAVVTAGRIRSRRRRRTQRPSLPNRPPAPPRRPPPPYRRPDVRRSALLAATVQLNKVAPAWATAVPGAAVPPSPPQAAVPGAAVPPSPPQAAAAGSRTHEAAASRDQDLQSTVDALAPVKSPTVQLIPVTPPSLARPYVDTRPRNQPRAYADPPNQPRATPDPPNRQAPPTYTVHPPPNTARTGNTEPATRNRGRLHGRGTNGMALKPPGDSGVRRHRPGY